MCVCEGSSGIGEEFDFICYMFQWTKKKKIMKINCGYDLKNCLQIDLKTPEIKRINKNLVINKKNLMD